MTEVAGAPRGRAASAATVLIPAALAIALASYELAVPSLWIDEGATFSITSQHGSMFWAAVRHDGGNMLAYYVVVHWLTSLFGHSALVMRLPSVLMDGLTAGATAAIGRRLFSRPVGFAAGLLSAVSLPLVYWGQDARAYSAMFGLCTVSYVAFVALVDAESSRSPAKPPWWAWPLYLVALVLAAYMSLVALLVIPAQLVSLYWYRRRGRYVSSAIAVCAVLVVPLLLLARARGSGQLFWVARPGLSTTGEVIQALASSSLASFPNTSTRALLLALTLGSLVAAVVVAIWRNRVGRNKGARTAAAAIGTGTRTLQRRRWAVALVVAWLVVPALLDAGESFVGQSIFVSRYLVLSVPAMALVLAWVFLASGLPRLAGSAAVGLLLVLRMLQIVPTYGVSQERWQAVTSYVLGHARPDDCIAFYPGDARQPFDFYVVGRHPLPRDLPRPVLPPTPFRVVKPFVEDYATLTQAQARRTSAACERLWLVSSHAGVPHQTPTSEAHYLRFQALTSELERSYSRHTVRAYDPITKIHVWLFSH